MGDVEHRVRDALLKVAPEFGPFLLEDADARREALKGLEPDISFFARSIVGLTRGIMLLAREIDLLRNDITHRS
jgi:hypothetical protein